LGFGFESDAAKLTPYFLCDN